MQTGTVKWFNGQKGFGFIQPDTGGNDVFVHISAVERAGMAPLQEGQKLGFEVERDERSGKMAAGKIAGRLSRASVRSALRIAHAPHERDGRPWRKAPPHIRRIAPSEQCRRLP